MRLYVLPAIAAVSLGVAACNDGGSDNLATDNDLADDPALNAALGAEADDANAAGGEAAEGDDGGPAE